MILQNARFTSLLVLFLNTLITKVCGYDPPSRWGQATVVVNDALYVFGGKTDEFNQFSYTSAPNTNDILYLSLALPFPAQSPPWELVSSSSNSSTSQGPALAWATLSAFSPHEALLFGGLPDANSDIVNVGRGDSAFILDIMNRLGPEWRLDASQVPLDQPIRRIHHSTITLPSGLVFIFGGERADGSRTCLADNWVFDPSHLSFTELPSENAPPGLCGPVSVPLPDGRILVFGGFSSSSESLLPFSTIYVLDTTRTPYTWSTLDVASDPLPSPRRGFAAVLISSDRVLIHGGGDASSQTSMSDGWILDLSHTPATWSERTSLSGLGGRRDHFAVPVGDYVVFGFGYGSSSPAPPEVQVYDVQGDTFVPEYSPPPISSTPTRTLPLPSQTSNSGITSKHQPTSSVSPSNPTAPGDPGQGSQSGGNKKATAIAIGTAIGALALIVLLLSAFYYRRHRQRRYWDERRFVPVSPNSPFGDDDNDSQINRNIPRAGFTQQRKDGALLRTLGLAGIIGSLTRNEQDRQERRNMLDDEDREFGTLYNKQRRDGTNGSVWSLLSFLGGGHGSREASIAGHSAHSSTPWGEKSDPFSDNAGLVHDAETQSLGAGAVRPKNRRETSYVSNRSALSYSSYTDPFSDPIQEERRETSDTSYSGDAPVRLVNPRGPPVTLLHTSLPLEHVGHPLSPLSERTSQSTLNNPESASASSSDHVSSSRFSTVASRTTSGTSQIDSPTSPTLLSNMLTLPAENKVRRSDSWWSKLGRRTSLAESTRPAAYTALRDPNPPPRLVTIDESVHSRSPDKSTPTSKRSSPGSAEVEAQMAEQHQREHSQPYTTKHGKSMSSLRTTDTEVIERMAGTMEVVQRRKSGSQGTRRSTDSTTNLSLNTDGSGDQQAGDFGDLAGYASPTEMDPHEAAVHRATSRARTPPVSYYRNVAQPAPVASASSGPSRTLPPAPSGGVAARIQDFERRSSQDQSKQNPSNNRGSVDYGLVPRRSLFVANPDRRTSHGSAES
ncbi:galactose oxidase [Coprinopsis marcescibilis]|uniref:Galactose oxidase n=1 Tax=Coprinopsis marcescibilis TaxID=230819 RepID=A0A5C3KJM6_COPMA|nr:galactose oxidase [Coprinopsis marcescibilis]